MEFLPFTRPSIDDATIAAVADVTSSTPLPRCSMYGNITCARRNRPKVAMRQPTSNAFKVVLARPRSPICAPRLNSATPIGPISASMWVTSCSMLPSSTALSMKPVAEPPSASISATSLSSPALSLRRARQAW